MLSICIVLLCVLWLAVLVGNCLLVRGAAVNEREYGVLKQWQVDLEQARALRAWRS